MAIYRLPPSPFVGGRQPLAHRDFNPAVGVNPPTVDDPPFNSRATAIFASVLIAWQPIQVQAQQQRFVPQVAEQKVPFNQHSEIYNSWVPDVVYQQKRIFVPIVEAAVVSEVIPYNSRLATIISNWQDKLSFIQIRPFVPTVSIGDFVPYLRPPLTITIEPYRPIFQIKLVQPFVTPPVVNDPPFGRRDWLSTVLNAWEPPPPVPIKQTFVPSEPAVINDPPFGRRVLWLNTVLDAWIPPPPMPIRPLDHFNPPTSDDIIIWMWKRIL